MSNIVKSNGNNLPVTAADNANPFVHYGEQTSQSNIVGKLLKFSKGDWMAGQDNEIIEDETRLVANMDQLLVGWIRWQDNRPTDHIMGLVCKGYQAPRRDELGDRDEDAWEIDESTGRPRDPWQESNYLLMRGIDEDFRGELFTFTTSSAGGINAIGKLCIKYGKLMRSKPDQFPVVALRQGSYLHSNKNFGRIKFPIFDIVGWTPKSNFVMPEEDGGRDRSGKGDDGAQAEIEAPTEPAPAIAKPRARAAVAPPPPPQAPEPARGKAKARF